MRRVKILKSVDPSWGSLPRKIFHLPKTPYLDRNFNPLSQKGSKRTPSPRQPPSRNATRGEKMPLPIPVVPSDQGQIDFSRGPSYQLWGKTGQEFLSIQPEPACKCQQPHIVHTPIPAGTKCSTPMPRSPECYSTNPSCCHGRHRIPHKSHNRPAPILAQKQPQPSGHRHRHVIGKVISWGTS